MKKLLFYSVLMIFVSVVFWNCQEQSSDPVSPASSGNNTANLSKSDTYTQTTSFPIDVISFVSCAAGGNGEEVEITGTLLSLFHWTYTENGTYVMRVQHQPQGVSGVGLTTGDKYQGTGTTQWQFTGNVGEDTTYINNFQLIGQGTGSNFSVHETMHVTVNANGTVTADVDNYREECN